MTLIFLFDFKEGSQLVVVLNQNLFLLLKLPKCGRLLVYYPANFAKLYGPKRTKPQISDRLNVCSFHEFSIKGGYNGTTNNEWTTGSEMEPFGVSDISREMSDFWENWPWSFAVSGVVVQNHWMVGGCPCHLQKFTNQQQTMEQCRWYV